MVGIGRDYKVYCQCYLCTKLCYTIELNLLRGLRLIRKITENVFSFICADISRGNHLGGFIHLITFMLYEKRKNYYNQQFSFITQLGSTFTDH